MLYKRRHVRGKLIMVSFHLLRLAGDTKAFFRQRLQLVPILHDPRMAPDTPPPAPPVATKRRSRRFEDATLCALNRSLTFTGVQVSLPQYGISWPDEVTPVQVRPPLPEVAWAESSVPGPRFRNGAAVKGEALSVNSTDKPPGPELAAVKRSLYFRLLK